MNGKNLFLPSRSRESPASTPSFSMHLPISASSAPAENCDSLTELASNIASLVNLFTLRVKDEIP